MSLRAMTHEDLDAVTRLVSAQFVTRESMTVRQGIDHEEFVEFLHPIGKAALGTSVVALDDDSKEIVGCIVALDKDVEVSYQTNLTPKFDAIFSILDTSSSPEMASVYLPNPTLLISLVAVDHRYAGRGYAQRLIEHCLSVAKDAGFRSAFAQTTVMPSHVSFMKAGFTCHNFIAYDDFEHEGNRPFENIDHGVSFVYNHL
jgi:predicted N-acetyltransferase YhbS